MAKQELGRIVKQNIDEGLTAIACGTSVKNKTNAAEQRET